MLYAMHWLNYIVCHNKLKTYENYINILNNVIADLNNNKLNNKKDYKHNPFSVDSIDKIEIIDKKLIIKYKNNTITQTILFDYNENYRSFSFETNKQNHIKLIITQLNCQINIINIHIETINLIFNKIKNNIILDTIDNYYIYNSNYNLDDILKINKHRIKGNYEYYISICPIYGFLLQKGKIYIANQYVIKFENNNFNMFYSNKYNFKQLLHRHNLQNKILEFNKSNKKITTDNFLIIIENMRPIYTDCEITINSGEKIKYELKDIDKPINVNII